MVLAVRRLRYSRFGHVNVINEKALAFWIWFGLESFVVLII